MVATWTDLPDKSAGDAVTYVDWNALKDHADALASGATGAPAISLAALGIGGGGVDGAAADGDTPSTSGQYFYSSVNWSSNRTLPSLTWLHISGDSSISGTITPGANPAEYGIITNNGGDLVTGNGPADAAATGGGAGWGSGGDGFAAGTGTALSSDGADGQTFPSLNNPYLIMPKTGGGRGGHIDGIGEISGGRLSGGNGGGFLGILCDGDLDLTGLTFSANGGNGGVDDDNDDYATGGGGGGGVYIVCRGELTLSGASFSMDGGDGGAVGNEGGGGGGGGLFQAVAASIVGTPTVSVSGGSAGQAPATAGSAGRSNLATVSAGNISAMFYSLGLLRS